jgi:hypothetical protein
MAATQREQSFAARRPMTQIGQERSVAAPTTYPCGNPARGLRYARHPSFPARVRPTVFA